MDQGIVQYMAVMQQANNGQIFVYMAEVLLLFSLKCNTRCANVSLMYLIFNKSVRRAMFFHDLFESEAHICYLKVYAGLKRVEAILKKIDACIGIN